MSLQSGPWGPEGGEPGGEAAETLAGQGGEPLAPRREESTSSPGVDEFALLLRERDREVRELNEQVKRVSAEFANFRRRQEADRERQLEILKEELFRNLLPLVDHLERAAGASRAGCDVDTLAQGIDLVLRDTRRVLEKHGVEAIEAQGEPFDPSFHEAVLTDVREDVPDETVLEELQRGYRIGERVLRPSMVKVARSPGA